MGGRWIVLEGGDGVGKTTLTERLSTCSYQDATAALALQEDVGRGLVFVPRRQISATSPAAATLMGHLSTMLWHRGDPPDLPDSFWVGLQASWFTAHAQTVTGPLLAAGYDVIVDGWIYKICSKLLLQGYTQDDLDVIFGRVPVPDVVLLLAADPGALYDRRRQFRPAELGMHAGYGVLNRDTFVRYQQAGLDRLRNYAARYGWPVVELDPADAITRSAEQVAGVLASVAR